MAQDGEKHAIGSIAVYVCVRKALVQVRKIAKKREKRSKERMEVVNENHAAHVSSRGRPKEAVATERAIGSHAVYFCVRNAIKAVKKKRHYNEYMKERRQTNAFCFVQQRLRDRLRNALNYASVEKRHSTVELVGATPEEVIDHIGRDLWSKKGELNLEIDHIWPCTLYNLESEEEQKRCFNVLNLRLCTRKENRAKCNTIPSEALANLVPRHLWPLEFQDYTFAHD